MALSANRVLTTKQSASGGEVGFYLDFPVGASEEIYQGSFVSLDTDNAAALAGVEPFLGLSVERVTGGSSDGDKTVKTLVGGLITIAIASIAGSDIGADVYAVDDETLTLVTTTNPLVGFCVSVPVTGTAIVQLLVPGGANARA